VKLIEVGVLEEIVSARLMGASGYVKMTAPLPTDDSEEYPYRL
jgi:hypothetical protein